MQPKLQALLFDVDGTLADTEEVHRQAFNAAFSAAGLDWVWSRDLYHELLAVTGGKERIRFYLDRDRPVPVASGCRWVYCSIACQQDRDLCQHANEG